MPRLRALLAFPLALVISSAAIAIAPPASAIPTFYTWTGLGDGHSWTNALNWAPNNDYPRSGDAVSIAPVETGCAQAHVTDAPFDITLLSLSLSDKKFGDSICNASLEGGPISVVGSYSQNGATMLSELTVLATATASIESTLLVPIHPQVNADLTVDGSLEIRSLTGDDALYVGGGTTITASSGATISFSGDNDVVGTTCCVDPPRITNNGTVHLDGHVDVTAAQLDQNGLLETVGTGSITTSHAPATASGGTFTGPGYWELGSASTTTMAGAQTLGPGFRLILGGAGISGTHSLSGTFSLAGQGTFEWRGGQLQSDLTIGHSARLLAAGTPGAGRYLFGRDTSDQPITVTNHGTVSFTGGAGYYNYRGALVNASDGTLNLGAGTTIDGDCCGTPGSVRNLQGHLTVGAGATPATLTNVEFAAAGGTTSIAPGQRLRLVGGGTDALAGGTITGGGTLDIASPTVLQGGASVETGTTVLLRAYPGTLVANAGKATLSGAGKFAWRGGSMSGDIDIDTTGGAVVGPPLDPSNEPIAKYVVDRSGGVGSNIRFTRAVTMLAGTGAVANQVEVSSYSVLSLLGPSTLNPGTRITGGALNNLGSMRVSGAPGLPVVTSSTGFFNKGDITVGKGRLEVGTFGTIGGTITVAKDATLASTSSSRVIQLLGGVLQGTGHVQADVVNTRGTVSPGLDGTGLLTIDGSLVQGDKGTLALRLAPKNAGTSLKVTGLVSLKGRLRLSNAYAPKASSKQRPVVSGTQLTLLLGCTTTTGKGTRGDAARHWVAKVERTVLLLRSVKGRRTSC